MSKRESKIKFNNKANKIIMIGQMIGQFQIVEKLGSGGMGTVYKAKDTRLNRMVAIKALNSHITSQSNAYKRFKNEAQISAQITHPNVAALYDFIQLDNRSYIIMELVKGATLEDMITAQGPLSEATTIDYIIQILKGLGEAHQLGILHRDLKPSNIMVTKSGFAKLMDFGIAKMDNTTRLTAQNKVIGTMEYLAPEIYTGKQPSKTSDLYAIGVIMHEMLTGKTMFQSESEASLMYQIVHHKPKLDDKNINPQLLKIIRKLISKSPKNRYRNADELIQALKSVKTELLPVFRLNDWLGKLSDFRISISQDDFGGLLKGKANRILIFSMFLALLIVIIGAIQNDSSSFIPEELETTSLANVDTPDTNTLAYSKMIKPEPTTIEIRPIPKVESSDEQPAESTEEKTPKSTKTSPAKRQKTKPKTQNERKKIEITKDSKESVKPKDEKEEDLSNDNSKENIEEEKGPDSYSLEVKNDDKTSEKTQKIEQTKKQIYLNEQYLPVRFNQAVSSKQMQKGQTFYIETSSNIYKGSQIAIPKGSRVKCYVKENKRKGNGKVIFSIQFQAVESMTGDWLTLSYPEYSKIERHEVVFPAGTQLSKIKLNAQTLFIYQ